MKLTLSGIVLDTSDAQALASFYQRLLGWSRSQDEPGWVKLADPAGGPGLSFAEESDHVPPVWPAAPGSPQMQLHLDIAVADLDKAGNHAIACGARLAEFQPQQDVRVFLHPAGHPFCLFLQS